MVIEVIREDGSRELSLEGGTPQGGPAGNCKGSFPPREDAGEPGRGKGSPPEGRRRAVRAKRTRAMGSEPFDTVKCPVGRTPAWLKPGAASTGSPLVAL